VVQKGIRDLGNLCIGFFLPYWVAQFACENSASLILFSNPKRCDAFDLPSNGFSGVFSGISSFLVKKGVSIYLLTTTKSVFVPFLFHWWHIRSLSVGDGQLRGGVGQKVCDLPIFLFHLGLT